MDGALPDGGPVLDGGAPPVDGGGGCEAVQAVIGANGGELTLCGATVSIAPGSLSRQTTFRFSRVTEFPAPSSPVAVDGHVYRLEPSDVRPLVTVTLPHSGDSDGVDLFEHTDAGWQLLGLCEVTETIASQTFVGTGTFALLRDVRELPTVPFGLGSASVDLRLADRTARYESDGVGYGVVSPMPNGALDVVAEAYAGDGSLVQLELLVGPGEAMEPWSVFHLDATGALHEWTSIYAGIVPMDLTLTPTEGGFAGRLYGEVLDETGARSRLDARLDLTVVDWKPLRTRVCME